MYVPATEERYVRAVSDCISTSHTSPSKNKNINYMFIYLRVFFCSFSSCVIYDIYDLVPVLAEFLHRLITNVVTVTESTGRLGITTRHQRKWRKKVRATEWDVVYGRRALAHFYAIDQIQRKRRKKGKSEWKNNNKKETSVLHRPEKKTTESKELI